MRFPCLRASTLKILSQPLHLATLRTPYLSLIFTLLTLQPKTKSQMAPNATSIFYDNSTLYFDLNESTRYVHNDSNFVMNAEYESSSVNTILNFSKELPNFDSYELIPNVSISSSVNNVHTQTNEGLERKGSFRLSSSEKEKNYKKKLEVDEATKSKLFWDFSATIRRYNSRTFKVTETNQVTNVTPNPTDFDNITMLDDFEYLFNRSEYDDYASNMSREFQTNVHSSHPTPDYSETKSPELLTKQEEQSKMISILGLFELTVGSVPRPDGLSELAAARLAVTHINQRQLLPGYTLQLITNDTKCDPGVAVDRFFYALYTERGSRIVMLLGTACSEVTETVAKIVPYWNIVQVSFGSTSPALSDRSEFPLFYRTVAPDSSHNLARIAFIRQHGWHTVTAFSQNEGTHSLAVSELVTQLEAANVSCGAFVTFAETDFKEQLRQLKEFDTRIIIGSFSQEMIPKIFCEVYRLGMFGGQYAWLVSGEPPPLPPPDTSAAHCEPRHLAEALESIVFVDSHRALLNDETGYSGLTNEMFTKDMLAAGVPLSPFAPQAYDAVWSIALALRRADRAWGSANDAEGGTVRRPTIGEFDYNRRDMAQEFLHQLGDLNFTGVSGPITFNGADRIGTTVFYQIQEGRALPIALFALDRRLRCGGCAAARWAGGVPAARRVRVPRLQLVWVPARLVVTVLAAAGILLAAVFLHYNLHYSKRRSIKLSSPRLNNMTLVGSALVYAAVALLGVDSGMLPEGLPFTALCTGRVYVLSAGFSLAFGSMFAKTYRVHRIFVSNRNGVCKTRLLQDAPLIVLVCVLLGVDGALVTLWTTLDPMTRHLKDLAPEYSPEHKNIVYQPQVEICKSHNTTGWLCALYTYKALFLIVGVYMAWETRNVKISALNDSKYIGISVYCVVLTSISVVATGALLSEKVTVAYIVTSSLILLTTTSTLCLMFMPKILAIRSNGEIDPVTQSLGLKMEYNTRRFVAEDPQELRFRVEVQNRVYRRQARERDGEIDRLERLLAEPLPSIALHRRSELNTVLEEAGARSERRTPSITGGLPMMLLSVLPPVIPRASWPSADAFRSRHSVTFSSQPKLNQRKSQPNIDLYNLRHDKTSFLSKIKNFFSSRPGSRKASTISIADPTGQSIAAALKFHAGMLAGLMPGSRKHSMVVSCNTLNVPPIEMKLRRESYAKSGPIIRITDDEPTCSKYIDDYAEATTGRNKYVAEPETKVNFVLPTPHRRMSHHSSQKIKGSPRFPHRISPATSSLNNFDMKRNSSESVFNVTTRFDELRRLSQQCNVTVDTEQATIKTWNSSEDATPGPSTQD